MSTEDERIARIAAILGASGARVGIGDDAAVLDAIATPIVITVDAQVEGSHFERSLCSFGDVGFRATMAAASDLAAMGAKPIAAVAALVLPRDLADADLDAIVTGQREACDRLGAKIIGGNLARGPTLSIATTWIGTCDRPITRRDAKIGDGVYIAGDIGLAAAGFRALRKNVQAPIAALSAWRRPCALIAEGLAMSRVAHACIDVSDGLAIDLGRLARASGVRALLDESALRKYMHTATITIAAVFGEDPLDLALTGGEDYALVCASPSDIDGFVRIGEIVVGDGVVLRGANGERAISGGFDHFAD